MTESGGSRMTTNGRQKMLERLTPEDRLTVEQFEADLIALSGMTPRQQDRQRIRWMVERGEFSPAELELLCGCYKPNCIVHAEDYKP